MLVAAVTLLPVIAGGQVSPDGRGPVAGWENRVRVSPEGVQALGSQVMPLPDAGPWQPHWIWAAGRTSSSGAQFRRMLTLSPGATVKSAMTKISADRTYRLWVNGHLVSRGPDDPGFDVILSQNWTHQWLYNQVDLAPYLHPGANMLAAEVLTLGSPSYSLKRAGFALDLTAVLSSGKTLHVGSDSTWTAQALQAYSTGLITEGSIKPAIGKPPEMGLLYDARLDLPVWKGADVDSHWAPAVSVDSVWGTLAASRIPQTMETIYPIQAISRTSESVKIMPRAEGGPGIVRVEGPGSFSVDYDRVLSAYASFRVTGPAGAVVTLQTAETKTNPSPRRSAQITLAGGETIFEQPVYDAFSTFRISVTHADGPVEFSDLRATFVSQPVTYRGSFVSSDEKLNALWQAARWSTQICMQNHYLDSPNHQEPIGDFGDYLIESLENDYAFNAQALARQDLRKFGLLLDHSNSTNFHTSYSLLWLQMLMDYYDWSGDLQTVADLKPTVDRLLDHFATFVGANGILSEAPNYMFMDWVTIAGFPTHHPPAVIGQGYLTAFYYRALADGARASILLRDVAQKQKYEALRTKLKNSFERELWDAQANLYRDGRPGQNHQPLDRWLPADKNIETHSTQVNALAVLYDLAPRERQSAIMDRLDAQPELNVQPYFMHFLFAAEAHAGTFDRVALKQMHLWHLNAETKTFSENFGGGDLSHAWGGTPLIQMSARILGVTVAEPGGKRLNIEPVPAGLTFARGTVPTMNGDVIVDWRASGANFTLDVTLPPGTQADVRLPSPLATGRAIQADGKPRSASPIHIGGGAHHFVVPLTDAN